VSVASWCCTCFCVILCVGFCKGHFVKVPLHLTYLHCYNILSLGISSIYIIKKSVKQIKCAWCVFQENVTLKDAVGGDGSVVPRVELER